jgi:hypothetical protein
MTINLVDSVVLQEVYRKYSGGMPTEILSLTEMLRQELWALGISTRRSLCSRIAGLVQPLAKVSMDTVREVLDEMGRSGDVTIGPKGAVAAAPLRVVDCGGNRFRLFGTLPNRYILDYITLINPVGTARELVPDSAVAIDTLLEKFGGVSLTPERWAGFESVLPAGTDWLEHLDFRLDHEAENPGAFDSQVNDTWMVYRPAGAKGKGNSSWKKSLAADDGKLWRGWSPYGWPIFVWTSGGSPGSLPSLRLTSDESSRTVFSLAMDAGNPIVIQVNATGPAAMIFLDVFLPSAEYRYLMTLGELTNTSGSQRVFRIPPEAWPGVENVLRERLQVTIENKGT